jgi:epoxyqueuosine reductase QueG
MLPGHRSVVCIIVPQSQTALASNDLHVKQYDTLFTYEEVFRVSHRLARRLDEEGYLSLAAPAFLPLDMADGKLGMVGAIDWKRAAVECGLAARGKSGLAISPRLGPRIRIGGVITIAGLDPDERLDFSPCEHCQACVKACPVGALLGEGQIDKKKCAESVLRYGLRAFTRLLEEVASARGERRAKEIVRSYRTRELWQALETGNYYYCWACQSPCPVGEP